MPLAKKLSTNRRSCPDPHREEHPIGFALRTQPFAASDCNYRCSESAMKYWHLADDLVLETVEDKDLDQFIFEFQTTGVKLGGALAGVAEGRPYTDNSFTVAYLKRALDHLHKSQAGLEAVAPKETAAGRDHSRGAAGIAGDSRRHFEIDGRASRARLRFSDQNFLSLAPAIHRQGNTPAPQPPRRPIPFQK